MKGSWLRFTTVLLLPAALPAAAQTVTSVYPPVVGQSIGRAVGRISFAGSFDPARTISDGGAITFDSGDYGRGTRTYEFDVAGNGVNTPGAIAVVPASATMFDAGAALVAAINNDPTCPFWAVHYWAADVANGWVSFVWKYKNEWRLTAGGGLSLTKVAGSDPAADFSASNFSTNNPTTLEAFLQLRGTGLGALTNSSVKLRHDVNTNEVFPPAGAVLTAKSDNAATAKIALSTGVGSPPVFPSLGDYDLEVNGVIVIDKAVKLVENLVDDPSFHQGPSGGSIGLNHNAYDFDLGPHWRTSKLEPAPDGLRKGSLRKQASPRQYPFATGPVATNNQGDNPHASLQWSTTGDGVHQIWQTVNVDFAVDTPVTLTGLWAGESNHDPMTYGVELRSGGLNGTIIAQSLPGQKLITPFDWAEFAVGGVFPAGTTQITVVFHGDHPSTGGKVLHIDDLLLRVDTDHPAPPSITGMTTADYAVTGTSANITLTGANLAGGQTSVKLQEQGVIVAGGSWANTPKNINKTGAFALYQWRSGDKFVLTGGAGVTIGEYAIASKYSDDTIILVDDINGSNGDVSGSITGYIAKPALVGSVSASGTQVTASFDLTGEPAGYRNIIVEVGNNLPIVWRDGFNVVQPGPTLVNNSFELPEAPQDCDNRTETHIPATDWNARFWNRYMESPGGTPILSYRDDRWITGGYDLPSCPPADRGLHYHSTSAYNANGTAQYSQTVTAEAGKIYTLSGFFGHTDLNKISLSLLDGDSAAPAMTGATTEVLPAGSFQDWTFAYVTGTATGGLMTAAWEVENVGSNGPRVAWTDHLVLEECTQPVTVTSVSPPAIANDVFGPVTLTITGSGFSGTPVIHFVATGHGLEVDNVVVVNDTTITCEVNNWPTPATVAFDVIVRSNGCIGELSEGFVTASTALLNPEFEDPAANLNCDPRTPNTDRIDFWNFSDQLIREGDVHAPAECPLLSCSCPTQMEGCAGGHYASMSTGEGEDEIAWQTLKVIPGSGSNFGGFFSWGGSGTVNIKLVDGYGPDGTVLASTSVPQGNEWCFASVEGFAQGHLVTVVWELVGTTPGVPSAVHADSMRFAASPCHDPFADVDSDGDVDQEDFAVLQRCYTGPNLGPVADEPVQCACLDVEGSGGMPDNDIDAGDLAKFQLCASGPFILADPACDD
ncbi:MAG: hypothetical protein AMXMBFR13_20890 [Phycisphaerae bacterium]